MKILEFRIKNFKSIVDTKWRQFSSDNVTVFIGQNESGKTSILEALSKTFSDDNITNDDTRIQEDLPSVCLKINLTKQDIDNLSNSLHQDKCHEAQIEILEKFLIKEKKQIELEFQWEVDPNDKSEYIKRIYFTEQIEDLLQEILDNKLPETNGDIDSSSNNTDDLQNNETTQPDSEITSENSSVLVNNETTKNIPITLEKITDKIFDIAPQITLFEHQIGLLPSQINITKNQSGKYIITGAGSTAARNFLTVAGLDLNRLINCDDRTRANLLTKANEAITRDFSIFWSQKIGKTDKLKLECEVQKHGTEAGDKAGTEFLKFWINDGLNKLYPKQRSLGVRWFISFYLQLKASEMQSNKRLFLLDEPGANLHSKAQSDVLKLINELSKDIHIVYSTHIPHMLEYDKFYRVLAVQRIGETDDSPTEIKHAHELGTASSDTLSPVLTTMGADLSNQEVIKKKNNVILEEMSGFYYLKAFWALTSEKQEAHFIASTGVNKIPQLANMFLGWGLDYIVLVDDDGNGRKVYNELKKEMFCDDEKLALKNMYKIKDCDGIEDVFSKNDFKAHVINDLTANIQSTNSNFMKVKKLSKPFHAYSFVLKAKNNEIKFEDFELETQNNINKIVNEITSRLKD